MCCIILCYIRYFAVFCSTCSFLNFESSHLYSNPLYYSFKNLVKVVAKWNVKKRFKLKICCNFTLYLIQYTMYHFISYQGEGIYFHVNCSQKYFVTINSYGIEKDFVLISLKFTTLFSCVMGLNCDVRNSAKNIGQATQCQLIENCLKPTTEQKEMVGIIQ